MSESKKGTLDYLMERFFKPGIDAKDYKALMKLNISELRNVDGPALEAFKDLSLESIKDLVKVNTSEIKEKLEDKDLETPDVDAVLVMVKILKKLLNKKSREKVERVSKVAVMGMQNAGKTSFINYLTGEKPDEKFKETSPTVSVAHKTFELKDVNLAIWDFGGQESFRKEYLDNPEEFFLNTEVLLYIIDTQDDELYADSLQYFFSVLEILDKTGVDVHIIVDFHKCDPDVIQDIDFIVKMQWLEEKFREILSKFSFPHEFMRSSIFSEIATENEPEIAKNLKEIFVSKSEAIGQPSEMELLKNLLYVQTKTYLTLMSNFMEMMRDIKNLEYQVSLLSAGSKQPPIPGSQEAGAPAPSPTPVTPGPPPLEKPAPVDARLSIVNE
ncbi:hypothetical protein GF325_11340, partial [Candidatus Bathyarchaeota archaeon]|nr:hypothetical protein [Candidatus Bathyarchaeota archaeon]